MQWVSYTSGTAYTVSESRDGKVQVTKLVKYSITTEENITQSEMDTKSQVTPIMDEDEGTITGFVSQQFEPTGLMVPNMTAEGRSLLTQLRKGIKIKSRKPNGRDKKISMKTTGLTEKEILDFIIKDPKINMPKLLRHFQKERELEID
ncbi:unnamed protein product [Parnassius apollo]|uniref:(apollo) hypothetical protein n=1 Tax=Parnassius apollo TaxID=110799 RepID=A0A8S3X6Z6_PARAO|nr:unnamed protein product [Parnassius apollo]